MKTSTKLSITTYEMSVLLQKTYFLHIWQDSRFQLRNTSVWRTEHL